MIVVGDQLFLPRFGGEARDLAARTNQKAVVVMRDGLEAPALTDASAATADLASQAAKYEPLGTDLRAVRPESVAQAVAEAEAETGMYATPAINATRLATALESAGETETAADATVAGAVVPADVSELNVELPKTEAAANVEAVVLAKADTQVEVKTETEAEEAKAPAPKPRRKAKTKAQAKTAPKAKS